MDRRHLLDRYAGGYDALVDALDGATDAELDARPPDGGWTARECVHHLADAEARSMLRLRQLLAEDDAEIQAYDQDEWAVRLPYDGPIEEPLAVIKAVRSFSLATLRRLDGDAWSRAGRHPEHDTPYSIDAWLVLYANHPFDHADQIRVAREALTSS